MGSAIRPTDAHPKATSSQGPVYGMTGSLLVEHHERGQGRARSVSRRARQHRPYLEALEGRQLQGISCSSSLDVSQDQFRSRPWGCLSFETDDRDEVPQPGSKGTITNSLLAAILRRNSYCDRTRSDRNTRPGLMIKWQTICAMPIEMPTLTLQHRLQKTESARSLVTIPPLMRLMISSCRDRSHAYSIQ